MRAGQLRRQITIESRATSVDADYGGQSTTWSTTATVWADIQPLSGRELFAAQQFGSEVSHVITVRYQSMFDDPKAVAAMRVNYNGRYFNIHACINTDERNREVQLMASEGLNDG